MPFSFVTDSLDTRTAARAGRIGTAHGEVLTPAFMPVGTAGSVKTLTPDELRGAGADILLANTYHLSLRPGVETVRRLGGLHRFMGWSGAILTDSGGFQVMSLSPLRKVTDEGVEFRSHLDGSQHLLTPEEAIRIQDGLGTDIAMSLDELVEMPAPPDGGARGGGSHAGVGGARTRRARAAARRGPRARWRCSASTRAAPMRRERRRCFERAGQRCRSTASRSADCGWARAARWDSRWSSTTARGSRRDQPRYLMGVGHPVDVVEAVARGVDMLDCVLPTRNARRGTVFISTGRLVVKNAAYAHDERPLDPECDCYTCRQFIARVPAAPVRRGRAARHAAGVGARRAPHDRAWRARARAAIVEGRYAAFRDAFLEQVSRAARRWRRPHAAAG